MEYNDILALNYQPFVTHFMQQAKGKHNKSGFHSNLVVVRATKGENKSKNNPEMNLVSPVAQNIDQAISEVKEERKAGPKDPTEFKTIDLYENLSNRKRKTSTLSKQNKKKRKTVHDIFSRKK